MWRPIKSLRKSSIVQIIVYVRFFEISYDILRNQNDIGLETCTRLRFAISTPFWISAGLPIAYIV